MIFKPSGKPLSITCNEQYLPEFPELLVGQHTAGMYFNPMPHLKKHDLNINAIQAFGHSYSMQINELALYHGVDGERICKLDAEGNIVLHGFLIYLFLSFVDVSFMAHMHERMDELLKNGITISDQCICQLAKERIPQEIITKLYGETAGS